MHAGKNNPNDTCTMMGSKLDISTQERDLGIPVDSSMKTSVQWVVAAKKANFEIPPPSVHTKSWLPTANTAAKVILVTVPLQDL